MGKGINVWPVSESWKDKHTGQKKEHTEWVRVSMFGRLAEIVRDYVVKGAKIRVTGKWKTRKWQDQNGQDRYTTEIVASEMQMLDSRSGQQPAPQRGYTQPAPAQQTGYNAPPQPQAQQGGYPQQPAPQSYTAPNQPSQATAPQPGTAAPADEFDDDIPF